MTMTTPNPPVIRGDAERFNLRDGQRPITFMGWKLAEANSQTGTDIRWTELTLYVTTSGKFVLEKIGRSDVTHVPNCPRGGKAKRYSSIEEACVDKDIILGEDETVEDIFIKCDHCQPDLRQSPICVERDIFSVGSHETAEALVDVLHRRDPDSGSSFLSRVARTLLEAASKVDENIYAAYNAPSDIT